MIATYRVERIKIWLDPEKYEKGYQTLQSLYAIGSGGIFGKGLGPTKDQSESILPHREKPLQESTPAPTVRSHHTS